MTITLEISPPIIVKKFHLLEKVGPFIVRSPNENGSVGGGWRSGTVGRVVAAGCDQQ